jgi:hypothetical protein
MKNLSIPGAWLHSSPPGSIGRSQCPLLWPEADCGERPDWGRQDEVPRDIGGKPVSGSASLVHEASRKCPDRSLATFKIAQ